MPTAPWRRLRITDIPRPAGRRWAGRLRRSGSLARQMLLRGRIIRRRSEIGGTTATMLMVPAENLAEPHDGNRARFTSIRRVRRTETHHAAGPARPPLGRQHRPAWTSARFHPGQADVGSSASVGAPEHGRDTEPAPIPRDAAAASRETFSASVPLLPGEHTRARRIGFVLVSACTLTSLVLGTAAVFLALDPARIRWSALCLMACVVADGLDGALARRLDVTSPFGAQLDSLADMCSFGLAAPVVSYVGLSKTAPAALVAPACGLVAICAAIRLARFNVSPKDGRYFSGVPTTAVAGVLATGMLVATEVPAWAGALTVAVLGLAMVSSFPYAKFVRLLRLPPWVLCLSAVAAVVDLQLTFVLALMAYLASGPLVWARHRQRAAAA